MNFIKTLSTFEALTLSLFWSRKEYPNTPKASGLATNFSKTRLSFSKTSNHNILEKQGESIWFVKDKVIKYSHDKIFIKNRIKRAEILKDFTPKIINHTNENNLI